MSDILFKTHLIEKAFLNEILASASSVQRVFFIILLKNSYLFLIRPSANLFMLVLHVLTTELKYVDAWTAKVKLKEGKTCEQSLIDVTGFDAAPAI